MRSFSAFAGSNDKKRGIVGLVGTAVICIGLSCAPGHSAAPGPGPDSETGVASWYGERFQGRPTASGEPFDMDDMTAAHRTLPFGTRVRVTHVDNQRSITVRINDRGPFIEGRVIDLSRAAAEKLNLLDEGTALVRVDVVSRQMARRPSN